MAQALRLRGLIVPRIGFEPMTYGLEGRCLSVDKRKKVARKDDKVAKHGILYFVNLLFFKQPIL